jgi:hypothetical protein
MENKMLQEINALSQDELLELTLFVTSKYTERSGGFIFDNYKHREYITINKCKELGIISKDTEVQTKRGGPDAIDGDKKIEIKTLKMPDSKRVRGSFKLGQFDNINNHTLFKIDEIDQYFFSKFHNEQLLILVQIVNNLGFKTFLRHNIQTTIDKIKEDKTISDKQKDSAITRGVTPCLQDLIDEGIEYKLYYNENLKKVDFDNNIDYILM